MRITQIEAIPIALPVRRVWKWRGLGGELGRWVIVRVHTDDGLIGLGEATPLPDWGGDFNRQAGETPVTVVHVVCDLLAPLLAGRSPFDVERIVADMDAVVRGHVYAKAAVEMALFDLQGKVTDRPVHDLLGGRTRECVAIAHMVGIMEEDEAVDEARAAQGDGCTAFQIKGTGELERDVAAVKALRAALGDGVTLRLDANQGYYGSGAKAAIRAVRALEDAGIDFIEQPTIGLHEMAQVCAGVQVPVIADESCWQASDVLDIVRARAADALSIYVAKAGGLLGARKVATLAEIFGLPCDVNGSLESGIGNAASVHLAVAMPAITLPAVIPVTAPAGRNPTAATGRYYEDDVVTEPFRYENGLLYPPEGPGLGVELDEERLQAYRTDR
jgi:L-alanine-DL-glutamate epimerase-like enolase superfamily enzyme